MVRRKFTKEFKFEAVKLVTERGVAVAQAARDLDLAESVLRRWMREAAAAPVTAFPGNGQQRAELAEIAVLKKEIAKLKAERDMTLLHKSGDGRGSPFPGRTYPTASVTGMPSAVYPFRTAIRTWSSAT